MNADELLPHEEEERRNDMMLLEIQNMNHPQLTQFIELYLDNTQNREVTLAIARVMQMFCIDASNVKWSSIQKPSCSDTNP